MSNSDRAKVFRLTFFKVFDLFHFLKFSMVFSRQNLDLSFDFGSLFLKKIQIDVFSMVPKLYWFQSSPPNWSKFSLILKKIWVFRDFDCSLGFFFFNFSAFLVYFKWNSNLSAKLFEKIQKSVYSSVRNLDLILLQNSRMFSCLLLPWLAFLVGF